MLAWRVALVPCSRERVGLPGCGVGTRRAWMRARLGCWMGCESPKSSWEDVSMRTVWPAFEHWWAQGVPALDLAHASPMVWALLGVVALLLVVLLTIL